MIKLINRKVAYVSQDYGGLTGNKTKYVFIRCHHLNYLTPKFMFKKQVDDVKTLIYTEISQYERWNTYHVSTTDYHLFQRLSQRIITNHTISFNVHGIP